jgi:NitT/TauT family transport system permease protein
VITLFGVWEGAVRFFGIREFLLPAPSAIWTATASVWPTVLHHTLSTLGTVLAASPHPSSSAYRWPC